MLAEDARAGLAARLERYYPDTVRAELVEALSSSSAEALEEGQSFDQLRTNGVWEEVLEYKRRLDFEVQVINQMGFPGYFLIVADFIKWAKDNGIPVGPASGRARWSPGRSPSPISSAQAGAGCSSASSTTIQPPLSAGTYDVTVTAKDQAGNSCTAHCDLIINDP